MILSDGSIRLALENGWVGVFPPPDLEKALQPASLDLRLGEVDKQYHSPGKWTLHPGEFILASTLEAISIPDDLAAQVKGRTTWARKGLLIHLTAGWVDPGFAGQLTLELKNLGTEEIEVCSGDRICSLVFYQLTNPASRPYGSEGLGSHYQGQMGPTESITDAETTPADDSVETPAGGLSEVVRGEG